MLETGFTNNNNNNNNNNGLFAAYPFNKVEMALRL